jgi:hypothetical protein
VRVGVGIGQVCWVCECCFFSMHVKLKREARPGNSKNRRILQPKDEAEPQKVTMHYCYDNFGYLTRLIGNKSLESVTAFLLSLKSS